MLKNQDPNSVQKRLVNLECYLHRKRVNLLKWNYEHESSEETKEQIAKDYLSACEDYSAAVKHSFQVHAQDLGRFPGRREEQCLCVDCIRNEYDLGQLELEKAAFEYSRNRENKGVSQEDYEKQVQQILQESVAQWKQKAEAVPKNRPTIEFEVKHYLQRMQLALLSHDIRTSKDMLDVDIPKRAYTNILEERCRTARRRLDYEIASYGAGMISLQMYIQVYRDLDQAILDLLAGHGVFIGAVELGGTMETRTKSSVP